MSRAIAPRAAVTPTLLAALLLVALVLQGYRYPFRINNSQTSPTYTDTPTWIQLGKWGVIAVLALALLATQLRGLGAAARALTRTQWALVALQAVVLGISLSLVARHAPSSEPLIMALIATVGLIVTTVTARGRFDGRSLVTVLVVYAVIALVVDVVQVILFVAFGRLPALAYENSPSVRFGSVLDDPNGFAVLLALLVVSCWFGLAKRPNARLVVVIGLLCCLPLTQSWTGTATTVVALIVTWVLLRRGPRAWGRAAAFGAASLAVIGTAAFFAKDTLVELVQLKHGSAIAHERSLRYLPSTGANSAPTDSGSSDASAQPHTSPTPIVPSHAPGAVDHPTLAHVAATPWIHIESGWVNLLVNYGWPLLVAYLALGVMAVVLLLRRDSDLPLGLRAAGAAFLMSFLAASSNLGLDRTFPCNLLFFIFCGLAAAGRPRERGGDRETTAPADVPRQAVTR